MTIEISTPSNLGYKKIDSKFYGNFLNVFKDNIFGYDLYQTSNELWIRRVGRGYNDPEFNPFKIKNTYTINNFNDDNFDFIREYKQSPYYDKQKTIEFRTYKDIIDKISIIAKKNIDNTAEYYNDVYSSSIFNCNTEYLEQLLKEIIFPDFFKKHPTGKIIVINQNFEFEKLTSLIRNLYLLCNCDFNDIIHLRDQGAYILKKWHSSDITDISNLFLSIFQILFLPNINIHISNKFGLYFVFIFSNKIEDNLPYFPHNWMNIASQHSNYGKQYFNVINVKSADELKLYGWGRLLHENIFSVEEKYALFIWFFNTFNAFYSNLVDVCNFCDKNDFIDIKKAFEFNLTTDRIIRKTLQAYTNSSPNIRKECTFEIADLYESIDKLIKKSTSSTFFKILFNSETAINIISQVLVTIPDAFHKYFLQIAQTIYNDLNDKTLKSIKIKSKISNSNGIISIKIKNKELTNESEISINEYTSQLIRCIRNMHHGYFSELDNQNRIERFVILSDGNISDLISYLPVIWLISFITQPEKFIGFKTLNWRCYPKLQSK